MLLKGGVATPSTPPLDPPLQCSIVEGEIFTRMMAFVVLSSEYVL